MKSIRTAPEPANRPKLYRFYRERGLTLADVAAALDRTKEWVRLITLPFDDPGRRLPAPEDVARFHAWSGGELKPEDWYPPELSAPPPANDLVMTPGVGP